MSTLEYLTFGWKVALLGSRVWLFAGYPYDALTVSGLAGHYVRCLLDRDGLAGPVAVWPGENVRYVFFVQPGGDKATVVRSPLTGVNIDYAYGGQRVELPTPRPGRCPPRWAYPPDRPAPSAELVMATALSVLLGDRRQREQWAYKPASHGDGL